MGGFMDVIQVEKTGENFRIIYDVKGRFIVHRITAAEAKYKLCRVREVKTGACACLLADAMSKNSSSVVTNTVVGMPNMWKCPTRGCLHGVPTMPTPGRSNLSRPRRCF